MAPEFSAKERRAATIPNVGLFTLLGCVVSMVTLVAAVLLR